MSFKRLTSAAALAAALSLAACSDSTGPGSLNPAALDNSVQNLSSTFSGNAVFQSLLNSLGTLPSFSATHLLRASMVAMANGKAASIGGRQRLVMPRIPAGENALFPANVLGKTFVWNTDSSKYLVDNSITGAPADGVRIRLYVTDQGSGEPALPLQVLGYIEIRDISTAQANALAVTLKFGGTTVASYSISNPTGTNFSELKLAGTLSQSDGTGTVTFSYDIYSHTDTGAQDWTITLSNAAANIHFESHYDTNSDGSELFRIISGSSTLALTGTTTDGVESGAVTFNGTQIATYSTSTGDLVLTGADGHPLSDADKAHLVAAFAGMVEVVFIFFLGLLAPALVVSAFTAA